METAGDKNVADTSIDKKTVFVRNIAFETHEGKLEETFSTIGPVRQCFLVREKGSEKHKGFGFIQYSLPEDAQKSVEALAGHLLDGRSLKVELAKKRAPLDQRRPKPAAVAATVSNGQEPAPAELNSTVPDSTVPDSTVPDSTVPHSAKQKAGNGKRKIDEGNKAEVVVTETPLSMTKEAKGKGKFTKPSSGPLTKKTRIEGAASERQKSARSVVLGVVSGIAVPEKALKWAREAGNLQQEPQGLTVQDMEKHHLTLDGCPSTGAMVLEYGLVRVAMQAVQNLHGKTFSLKGVEGKVQLWARQLGGQGSKLKQCRLIVRNLPFKVTEAELRELFSRAGFVWELKLPLHPDGRPRGFAFVGYTGRDDAQKAITSLNGVPLQGRPMAVDWALGKKQYEEAVSQRQKEEEPPEEEEVEGEAGGDDEVDGESSADEMEEDEAKKALEADEGRIMREAMARLVKGEREEAGEEEEKEGEGSKKQKKKEKEKARKERRKEKERIEAKKAEVEESEKSGVSRTVFVRGLPVDVSEVALRAAFASFGPLKACRVVRDKQTGVSKGSAFVEYLTRQGALSAVGQGQAAAGGAAGKEASNSKGAGSVLVQGVRVAVALAVDADEARSISLNKAKSLAGPTGGDKRNVLLAQEGAILEGSEAYRQMSEADKAKRERLAREKATKLASPKFGVSRTRLLVQNVPDSWTTQQLKEACLNAVTQRATQQKPTISQVKILKDKTKKAADGRQMSTGAAFVEFTEHEHAMAALRALNNNPGVFTKERRPIVEFAIENHLLARKVDLMRAQRGARAGEQGGNKTGFRKMNNSTGEKQEGAVGQFQRKDNRERTGKVEVGKRKRAEGEDGEKGAWKKGRGKQEAAERNGRGSVGGQQPEKRSANADWKKGGGARPVTETKVVEEKKGPAKQQKDAKQRKNNNKAREQPQAQKVEINTKSLGDIKRWFE